MDGAAPRGHDSEGPVGASPDDRPAEEARIPRRRVAWSLARTLANVAAVLVVYYMLPLQEPFGWRIVAILLGSLMVIGWLVAWQVRTILRSMYPALRAMETLALTVPLFLVLFAAAYVILQTSDAHAFSEPMTRTDAIYLVVTIFATVGFGDITAVTEVARVLVTVQMVGDLVVIGLVVRAVLGAVGRGQHRRFRE